MQTGFYTISFTFPQSVEGNAITISKTTIDVSFVITTANVHCVDRAVTIRINLAQYAVDMRIFFAGSKKQANKENAPLPVFFHG